ncbi:MAG: hypothetical protein Fues2KO_11960 [Fuerstiella sp.]
MRPTFSGTPRRGVLQLWLLSVAALLHSQSVTVAQEALPGEAPAESRIQSTVAELGRSIGDGAGPQIRNQLQTMLNAAASDDERLAAVAELQSLVDANTEQLDDSVARKLLRWADLVEAAVSGLKAAGAGDDARALVNELLIRTTIDFEDSNRLAHAQIIRRNYNLLRQNHPQVFAPLENVFARHYFNYNLHFTLSEPMLSRLVSDYRCETGGIADCILGAWVTGSQVTDTSVRADIKPSRGTAAFNLEVYGHTRTNTQGRKRPATIYTRGDHRFVVTKPTFFDGQNLTYGKAAMDVKINNTTTGVSTDYDRIPIFGGIARRIAASRAREQQPQADAIAARKLANQVLPRFEDEVSDKFQEANDSIQNDLLQGLRDRGIEPSAYSARSSESHLAVSSRTIWPNSLAASRAPTTPAPARGMAIQLHESALNTSIDSLGLQGQMKPSEVIGRVEESLSELLNREVVIDKSNIDDSTLFNFVDSDPMRVRFDDGQVVLILRTGFIQPEKNKTVPPTLLQIPLGVTVENGTVVVTPPGTTTRDIIALRPRSLDGQSSAVQARVVIKELLEKTFPEPTIDVDPNLELELADGSKLNLTTTGLDVMDGWLTVIME